MLVLCTTLFPRWQTVGFQATCSRSNQSGKTSLKTRQQLSLSTEFLWVDALDAVINQNQCCEWSKGNKRVWAGWRMDCHVVKQSFLLVLRDIVATLPWVTNRKKENYTCRVNDHSRSEIFFFLGNYHCVFHRHFVFTRKATKTSRKSKHSVKLSAGNVRRAGEVSWIKLYQCLNGSPLLPLDRRSPPWFKFLSLLNLPLS